MTYQILLLYPLVLLLARELLQPRLMDQVLLVLLSHQLVLHLVHAVDALLHGMVVLLDVFLPVVFEHVFLPLLLQVAVRRGRLIINQLLHRRDL